MNFISNKANKERRSYPRATAPVYYSYSQAHIPKRQVTTISPGGVRIYSDELLKEGTQIEIEIFLPKGFSAVGRAKVVWVKELPPGSLAFYDVGLEFIYLPPEAIDEIKSILRETVSNG